MKLQAVVVVLLLVVPSVEAAGVQGAFIAASTTCNPFSKAFWTKTGNCVVKAVDSTVCGGGIAAGTECKWTRPLTSGFQASSDFLFDTVAKPVLDSVLRERDSAYQVEPVPTKSPAELCAASHGAWVNDQCTYTASQETCTYRGLMFNPWTGTCVSPMTEATMCAMVGAHLWGPGDCRAEPKPTQSTQAATTVDPATACANQGLVLYNGSCQSWEYIQGVECSNGGGTYGLGEGCVYDADVPGLCERLGYLWVSQDKKCYVLEAAQVPRGLEKFFVVAQSAQEKALVGAYAEEVNLLLQEKDAQLQVSLAQQEKGLREFYQAEVDRITAEFEATLEENTAAYEEALAEYRAAYDGLLEVVEVITERLQAKYYHDKDASPGGAYTAIRRLLGVQGGQIPDASFTYPTGFPTPTDDGDTWKVKVPVEVSFPRVPLRTGEIVFEADVLVYAVSIDGGETFMIAELPIDFVGGGTRHDKALFNVVANIEKSGGNFDLVLYVGLMYVEHYTFGTQGYVFDLESYKESQPLSRTFYTSSNPFGSSSGSVVQTNAEAASNDQAADDGDVPGGPAGFYNWAAEQNAMAEAQANEFDAKTGFGLAILLKFWYVPVALLVGVVAYLRGWLDFIGPVRQLRTKRERDPYGLGDLGLDDDVLGGL